jgi:phage recombination protein Bet
MEKAKETSLVAVINKEINTELADPQVGAALLATTFKGLSAVVMKQAIMEGMIRGFSFKDFLEKNVYAIPFGSKYSLITSIDFARKIAMRSGLAGKSEPRYTDNDGKILTCSVTVKRNADGIIGDYTATVYFSEYTTGKNLWASKPHTMIAKVAEMHALRSAFPEEMAQSYIEEEMEKEKPMQTPAIDLADYTAKLKATKSADELKKVWVSIPAEGKVALKTLKDELKKKYESSKVQK